MKSLFSAVMLELITTSAVPMLSWKEQLTSSAYCVNCKSNACLAINGKVGSVDCQPKPGIKEAKLSTSREML